MLIIPSVPPPKYHKPWSQVIENAYVGLPQLNISTRRRAPLRKAADPPNLQTVAQFAAEHEKILGATQTRRWVKPSESDPDRMHEVPSAIIETETETPEVPVPVGAGRIRGLLYAIYYIIYIMRMSRSGQARAPDVLQRLSTAKNAQPTGIPSRTNRRTTAGSALAYCRSASGKLSESRTTERAAAMSNAPGALILPAALAVLVLGDARAAGQPTPSNGGVSASQKLQEVTVTAARQKKLMPRVRQFVDQIVAPENNGEDGIARWQVPLVCPLVSGLTRQHGEFILERLSEIARKAGVPLADEHCRPNLYVLVTTTPQELLRAMEKRNRPFTFGYETFGGSVANSTEMPEGVVNEFIETPRAVRVWYDANQKDPWGGPFSSCQGKMVLPIQLCLPSNPHRPSICNDTAYVRCGRGTAGGSHITLSAISAFSRVFVIIDRTRVHGVTFGQLTAYVAMVGLAKLRPDADLRDAPTILKLFNGAPEAAPAGLTAWDQAFLKSLYGTNQSSRGQSGQIARAMVRTIAP